ncbi:MAG: ATP synthase F1 subunit epsilon [Acidobacteriota bacterium]
MGERLHLEIVTRHRRVMEVEVDEVRLPGVMGELGILPGHTPLLTALAIGRVSYSADGQERQLVVKNGFAEVQPDRVTVLAREALLPDEIDRDHELKERDAASEALKSVDFEEFEAVDGRLRSAEAALEVLEKA